MERFSFTVGIGRVYLVIRSLFHQIASQHLSNRHNLDVSEQISFDFVISGRLFLYKNSGSVDRKEDAAGSYFAVAQLVQPSRNGTSSRQIVRSRFNIEKLPFANPLISPPSRASPVYYSQ